MADTFVEYITGLTAPAEGGAAVTPNDSVDLTTSSRGIFVGNAGDLKVDMVNGDTVTFTNLGAGVIHPIRAARVYSTGTTATSIVNVY